MNSESRHLPLPKGGLKGRDFSRAVEILRIPCGFSRWGDAQGESRPSKSRPPCAFHMLARRALELTAMFMVLYKYLTPARVDVLEGQRIRFTQPSAFNDPFEFRPCIGSLASQNHLREYMEQNYDQILERELREYPILSKELSSEVVVKLFAPLKSRLPDIFSCFRPDSYPAYRRRSTPHSIGTWGYFVSARSATPS